MTTATVAPQLELTKQPLFAAAASGDEVVVVVIAELRSLGAAWTSDSDAAADPDAAWSTWPVLLSHWSVGVVDDDDCAATCISGESPTAEFSCCTVTCAVIEPSAATLMSALTATVDESR